MAQTTVYVNSTEPVELRAPVGGRSFFRIENVSGAILYYSEDIQATPENGTPLADLEVNHFSRDIGQAVPQGTVWIIGSVAAPARQRVLIKEQHAIPPAK